MMGVCRLIRIWCRLFTPRSWYGFGKAPSVLIPSSAFIKRSQSRIILGEAGVSANDWTLRQELE